MLPKSKVSLERDVETMTRQSREFVDLHPSSKTNSRGNSDDPRWHLAQRIAVSRSIGRSPLLSEFLLYVCDRHIQNKAAELTEQRIGVKVFGRIEGYNSNDDNIVRNYARTLRKRVEEYFSTEGKHEDLGLEIPRGAYIPVFCSRPKNKPLQHEEPKSFAVPLTPAGDSALSQENPASSLFAPEMVHNQSAPSAEVSVKLPSAVSSTFCPFLALCILVAATITAYLFVHGRFPPWPSAMGPSSAQTEINNVLWEQLFQKERDTFIVPADSALVIMQGLTRRPVSLSDYIAAATGSRHPRLPGCPQATLKNLAADIIPASSILTSSLISPG
jgi:hypothetical protein